MMATGHCILIEHCSLYTYFYVAASLMEEFQVQDDKAILERSKS